MDWNKIKEKAFELKNKAVEIKDISLEKWKQYSSKALEYTSDTINKTPIALKIMADFEKIKNDKILIVFFLKKENEESKKILLMMPVIMTKWWINWATIRTSFMDESKEVVDTLQITACPTILYYKAWELIKKIEQIDEIKTFIKEFNV